MKSPVSAIMECLTNKKWGHGVDPASIDREAFEKLGYVPVDIPKIVHAEELKKMREHIAANPDGEPGYGDFSQIDKSARTPCKIVEVSAEKLAVETIRAKVSELNDAIAKAVEFGISVEIDTLSRHHILTGETIHVTAEISKKL